ncbi:hypothetical protein [Caudoviricetes sp.]|nr:hypothetical protein [Caudoviricetes sp.]UOF81123.1 hypothetical protein [Caudoviricetes sp.]UOF82241.1 hypothetical protein [Caudoviricetes sp.]UOF82468.1 hypothetical protein [Caudoviricetes sp.]UOF82622.1 hypothetical protein [Caudoviricetes sp.]
MPVHRLRHIRHNPDYTACVNTSATTITTFGYSVVTINTNVLTINSFGCRLQPLNDTTKHRDT